MPEDNRAEALFGAGERGCDLAEAQQEVCGHAQYLADFCKAFKGGLDTACFVVGVRWAGDGEFIDHFSLSELGGFVGGAQFASKPLSKVRHKIPPL